MAGEVVCPTLSLSGLLRSAQAAIAAANPAWDEQKTDAPRMTADLLFQEDTPKDVEIIRRNYGYWLKLRAPPGFLPLSGLAGVDELSVQADCTIVLSPLAQRHHAVLEALLAPGLGGGQLIFAAHDTAARGALFAARRMERGVAHYLDRLDPVAMAVMRRGGPVFEDLIPSHASVPGNREYVSKPLTGFVWSAGMKDVHFYLRKGATEIRTWHVTVDAAPGRDEELVVQLRQTPAQGWATLSVTAVTWEALRREPIRLDWGSLTIEPRTADEIIEALRGPRPAIPERIRYEALLGLWDGSLRRPGLAAVLRSFKLGNPGSVTALRDAVSRQWTPPPFHAAQRTGPYFTVSTDGELPDGLAPGVRDAFARTINQMAEELLRQIRTPSLQVRSNDPLACLTWIFAACPSAVRHEVILAFEAWLQAGSHKLLQPRNAVLMIVHGLGRISADGPTLRRLLPRLIAFLPKTTVLAPLASILSRPLATPGILARMDVDDALDRLRQVFVKLIANRSFGVNFKHAQMALAGLLRVREHQPWALMAARSASAREMAEVLEEAITILGAIWPSTKNLTQKHATTEALLQYLATHEGSA